MFWVFNSPSKVLRWDSPEHVPLFIRIEKTKKVYKRSLSTGDIYLRSSQRKIHLLVKVKIQVKDKSYTNSNDKNQQEHSTHEMIKKMQTKMEESDKKMEAMGVVLHNDTKESQVENSEQPHLIEEANNEEKREMENKKERELEKRTFEADPHIDHIE